MEELDVPESFKQFLVSNKMDEFVPNKQFLGEVYSRAEFLEGEVDRLTRVVKDTNGRADKMAEELAASAQRIQALTARLNSLLVQLDGIIGTQRLIG
jgi:hypothetical protein